MSATKVSINGVTSVTYNYVTILTKEGVNKDFHFIQDFLLHNDIVYTLTQPEEVSVRAVLVIWNIGVCNAGNQSVPPSISFTHSGKSLMITPTVVREALQIPTKNGYNL